MPEAYVVQLNEVERLRAQLAKAERTLFATMVSEYPMKVGDIVKDKYEVQYLISALQVRSGKVLVLGRKQTRSGWHASTWQLSWRDLRKVVEHD